MSDKLNLKDVYNNGERLFKEKDFDAAIKNFKYVQKNGEGYDLELSWNIAK
jgi:hypothetical protein